MLYDVTIREVRIVKRIVRVEAAGRADAREAALDPDKWLTSSDLHDDVEESELHSMEATSITHLWQRGEAPTVPD